MARVLPLEMWEHILSYVDDFVSAITLIQEHPQLRQRYIQEERWKDLAAFTCREERPTTCSSDVGKDIRKTRTNLFLQGYPKQVICTLQLTRGYKTKYQPKRTIRLHEITLFIGNKQYKMQGSERFTDYLSLSDILHCLQPS